MLTELLTGVGPKSCAVQDFVPVVRLNIPQRIVIVVGLGFALMVFGDWAMTWGTHSADFGWVGYAPLSNAIYAPGRLHPWVRMVIWLVLIAVWIVASVFVLRARKSEEEIDP